MIIRNDQNLEERISVVLTPLNLLLILSSLMVLFATAIILLLPMTPLRSLLPGGQNVDGRNLYKLQERLDSLEDHLEIQQKRNEELLKILKEENQSEETSMVEQPRTVQYASLFPLNFFRYSKESGSSEKKEVPQKPTSKATSPPAHYIFFTPLKGLVTDTFNMRTGHTAVDVVSYSNAAVKSTLDGTVILSSWTPETGHVMVIQHRDNFISVYKHNSTLYKGQGDRVQAGEVIALVGNSGELTTGPHLHFELWYNGRAVNPTDFMSF